MGALIRTWLDFKFPQIVVPLLPHPLMNTPSLVAGRSASGTTAAPKVCPTKPRLASIWNRGCGLCGRGIWRDSDDQRPGRARSWWRLAC